MSTTTLDPYATLGVARTAEQDAIRKAFKKLARQYHPDVNKAAGAEDRFKQINAAYEAVGDPEKRKLYDEFGDVALRPGFDAAKARAYQQQGGGGFGGGGGFPGGFDFSGGGGGVDVEDLLGSLFGMGGGGGGRRSAKGRDQETSLNIDFMTTVLGAEREISLRRQDGGVERIKLRIPAGARDGGKLKVRGQGLPPPQGGPAGDLYVVLNVSDHPLLRRDGNDLELDIPITVLEAMQGASITVPTPTGDVKVKVPAGTKSGARLRLRGRGIQTSKPGDLYLILRPTVPDEVTPAALAAAEALEEAYGDVREALSL